MNAFLTTLNWPIYDWILIINCSFALLKDRFIENNIGWFVILNEVKNLFLHSFRFIGIILICRPDASLCSAWQLETGQFG